VQYTDTANTSSQLITKSANN